MRAHSVGPHPVKLGGKEGLHSPAPAAGATTSACEGYVIDHIVPLKRGGEDRPENMQWQSVDEAKKKDRVE